MSSTALTNNYAGLDSKRSSWENSRVVIIPVPYDLTTTYLPGARFGPSSIIDASAHMELFDDETKTEISDIGIHTLTPVEPISSGPEHMNARIQTVVADILKAAKLPVLFGGDHSISLGAVKAAKEHAPDLAVIQFDAHCDLRNAYNGSPYNHACTGRRIDELCPLFQIGTRSLSREEHDYLQTSDIVSYHAHTLCDGDRWIETLCSQLPQSVYISIDLDVLDPSVMPSVGTPEPGGLHWYQIIKALKKIADCTKIIGFDIVELCPQPHTVAPDFLAAKLCYKLIGYIYMKGENIT